MVNVIIEINVTITKIRIYVRASLPKNPDDRKYRREILKTMVDLEKWKRGYQNNIILRKYMDDVTKAMDFDLKLQMNPVSV